MDISTYGIRITNTKSKISWANPERRKMAPCKISDSELLSTLRDKQYISYYAISKSIGLVCNTDLIKRCHRLEELYGIPERVPSRSGRPKENKPKKVKPISLKEDKQKAKPIKVEPFMGIAKPIEKPVKIKAVPLRPGEQVRYDGRLHTIVMVTAEKITLRKNADLSHKTLTMEECIQNPEKIVRIEEKRPISTTGEAIVLRRDSKYIKDTAETAKDFEPFGLEDNTDKVEDSGLFEPVDYIDEEWGQKLTLGEKIKKCADILFGEAEK